MGVTRSELAVFGQELYYDESIRAIKSFSKLHDREQLHAKIAETLHQSSSATRNRVAAKIIQRFFKDCSGNFPAMPFLKLVAQAKREDLRRALLYWRTACTDAVVGAIASEVFYPYFVLGRIPAGYDEPTFRMANTATLFPIDSVISRDFIVEYARRIWGFDSARTVTLALRIMRQAEMLDATSVVLGRRRVLGYYPRPHSLDLRAFAYCIYEEFLGGEPMLSIDRVYNSACVKTFLLSRLQVDSLVRSAERKDLVEPVSLPGGRRIRLALPSLEALVDALIR